MSTETTQVQAVEAPAAGGAGPRVDVRAMDVHPAETGAAVRGGTPVAALLAGHVLRDGEVVQLMLKPSLWFIVLTSLSWIAALGVGVAALALVAPQRAHWYVQVGIFLVAGRLMVATLQWMGRLYILTDYRILRIAGVFNVDIFDCPLRKVARAALVGTVWERAVRVGSIEILPMDEQKAPAAWQMIARPREVHEKVLAVIERAKQGHGNGGGG